MSSLLEGIFALSETQKIASSCDAQYPDLKCQAGEAAAKTVNPAKVLQKSKPEKRQCALRKCKAGPERAASDMTGAASSTSPAKKYDNFEEDELLEFDTPVLSSFQGNRMPLETPMHWLFY